MHLSQSDIKLLQALQNNLQTSQSDLADLVGMSRSSCARRIKDYEDAGLIKQRVAILEAKKLGLPVMVLLSVAMREHTDESRLSFETHVENLSQVMECYSVSGGWDYLMHVVAKDIDDYNDFINSKILSHPATRTTSSSFTLRRVKYSTELPL